MGTFSQIIYEGRVDVVICVFNVCSTNLHSICHASHHQYGFSGTGWQMYSLLVLTNLLPFISS